MQELLLRQALPLSIVRARMKVPVVLSKAFGREFEELIVQFAVDQELLPDTSVFQSPRYLSRAIVPHVIKLSSLFNRSEKDQGSSLDPYWKASSNPQHLRLAYFLYFMPSNLYRVASIWAELSRLGYRWPSADLRAIEFGAGPASGACGIAAGQNFEGTPLPKTGTWALIEQDKAILGLGSEWARTYFDSLGLVDWGIKPFHRTLDPSQGFLPRNAPKFNLWLMSYYLNELTSSPAKLAEKLIQSWDRHLEEEGIILLVEPALKLQSRRLLELRRELLLQKEKNKIDWLQILLPCLGHQACGALAGKEDWCHEEVSWWRPPYFRMIDDMAGLDRKTLPFSYLVITKSRRPREEILPLLQVPPGESRHRLVSPSHAEGKELEFFLCGQEGKQRARYRPSGPLDPASEIDRGDILLGSEMRGDRHSARISLIKKLI